MLSCSICNNDYQTRTLSRAALNPGQCNCESLGCEIVAWLLSMVADLRGHEVVEQALACPDDLCNSQQDVTPR